MAPGCSLHRHRGDRGGGEPDRLDEVIRPPAGLDAGAAARRGPRDPAHPVWELFHATDVPPVVAVDEAVELAKQLSTDESPGFVNGILGQVVLVAPQVRSAAAATSRRTETAGGESNDAGS